LAVLTLKKALEANPKSIGLRMELIRYHLGKDETDQVSAIIDKGLEIQPDDIALLRTKGEFEATLKNYSKAEQILRRIIEVRPNSAVGYMETGRLMLLQSKNDEAIDLFRQAMDKENGIQLALPALVQTYLIKNEPQAALSLVRNESIRYPESALVQYYLGQTLSVTGDLQGAETAFTRAAELSPGWLVAYNGLAEAFLRQGKVGEAISKIQEAYQINPSDHVLFQLAMLYEHAGRYADAIRICGELVTKSAGGPELMNNLAYLYAEHGTDAQALQKAADLMAKALARQPENPFFLDTAAWVAYMRGELDAAWYNMQSALARTPAEGLHCLHAAVILHARGEGKLSLEYLDKVLQQKTDPKLQERARDLRKEWTVSAN
jgi:tetratricopeptide (TPR) repeat protein